MSRLDDLPPDQRATLSLLLRQRKRYGEVAAVLGIQERAVHDRAQAALAVLAPREARSLSAEQRAEIGDYLLGQQPGLAERLATRSYLADSGPAHAWASTLATELEPLAGQSLAEIPALSADAGRQPLIGHAGGETAAPASPSTAADQGEPPADPPSRVSRRAGAVLLAGLLAAIIAVAVVLADSGGGAHHASSSGVASDATRPAPKTGSTATAAPGGAKEDKRIALRPRDPASKSIGVAEILSEGSKYAFYLAAEHLPPSKGFYYAVWLYNSPSSHEALSRTPEVGASGTLQGGALLPSDAGRFRTMLLTKETSSHPAGPGSVVLSGSFSLH